MIEWLIDNTFFSFGDKIYQQIIGIPMGTQCASFLANLFLFHYEYNFMNQKSKTDYKLCLKLNHTFRYQDDITVINDNNIFEQNYNKIYPNSLELIKINISPFCANVLDLSISINRRGNATIDIYDKRNDFNFNVTVFPDIVSNISTDMCYKVFRSQIIRYSTICTTKIHFENNTFDLMSRLTLRNFSQRKMNKIFYKIKRTIISIKKYYS